MLKIPIVNHNVSWGLYFRPWKFRDWPLILRLLLRSLNGKSQKEEIPWLDIFIAMIWIIGWNWIWCELRFWCYRNCWLTEIVFVNSFYQRKERSLSTNSRAGHFLDRKYLLSQADLNFKKFHQTILPFNFRFFLSQMKDCTLLTNYWFVHFWLILWISYFLRFSCFPIRRPKTVQQALGNVLLSVL